MLTIVEHKFLVLEINVSHNILAITNNSLPIIQMQPDDKLFLSDRLNGALEQTICTWVCLYINQKVNSWLQGLCLLIFYREKLQ